MVFQDILNAARNIGNGIGSGISGIANFIGQVPNAIQQMDAESKKLNGFGNIVVQAKDNVPTNIPKPMMPVQTPPANLTQLKAVATGNPVPPQPQATPNTIPGFVNWNPPQQYADEVIKAAQSHGVPAPFVAGIIQNENGAWNPNVRSNPNYDENGNIVSMDNGFGQVNDKAHPEITPAQYNDPNFVINFIADHLAQKYKETGSWPQSIASYNVGNMVGNGPNSGRDANGLGPKGRAYLNNALKNLDPNILKQLGIQTQY